MNENKEKHLKHLTLLHSNDLHGDFMAEELDERLVGGVSMLSGYVNRTREEIPNTLYMIAGDMFRGSLATMRLITALPIYFFWKDAVNSRLSMPIST